MSSSMVMEALLHVCAEMGAVPHCSSGFTDLVAEKIEANGVAVYDLTVGDLMHAIEVSKQQFNGEAA